MATTDSWVGTASADWGTSAANWSTGFPNSSNNVVIKTADVLTVSYSGGDTYFVNSLAVGNDGFDMSGGELTITTTASFADGFTQTGGILSAGGKVTISGAGTLTGGAAEGNTAFSVTGAIALANYTLGGATVLNNVATTNQTGQITLGDNTGIDATINNEKGATFDIAGDYGIAQGAATASFVNAGTLEKTGGSNTSTIAIDITDTGTITVSAPGTLLFEGPSNSFAGAISGIGQFAIGAGSSTIGSGTTITAGTFGIYDGGTLVTLGENLSYAGAFDLEIGAILDLGGHNSLTLSGTDTLSSATIDGTGTLVTAKGSTISIGNFTFGGTAGWQNSGTVDESAQFQIGDSSADAATFTNKSGGVYAFTNDNGISHGAAASSSFVNSAGATLEKTGGSGDSFLGLNVTDKGAIKVASGEIEFGGSVNTVAGSVSGAGEFELGDGSNNTVSGAAAISTAIFVISDNLTLVTLNKNLNYAHNLTLQNSATLDIGSFTLTLSGTDTLSSATLDGSGVLITKAGGTASVNNLTLGGSADWQNSGTVGDVSGMTLGDSSFNAATFINEKGGVFEFTTGGIARGSALNSSFINSAGAILENTGGDNIVGVDMADSGAVKVAAGTIEFEGVYNSIAGAVSGAGEFELGGASNDTIASGATISTAAFLISDGGTLVTLGENLSYTGIFTLQNSATLDLGGNSLTLSGTDTFQNSSTVDGTGTLVTTGKNTGVNSFTLGGEVAWQNSGTVSEQNPLTIGDGSFDVATFSNEKGGVYDFTNDNGIALGANATSSFVNFERRHPGKDRRQRGQPRRAAVHQ